MKKIRLKDNLGWLKTNFGKKIEEVKLIVVDPKTWEVDLSTKVTLDMEVYRWIEEKRVGLPVMWFVALKWITHFD